MKQSGLLLIMLKNAEISTGIVDLVAAGKPLSEAINEVLGEGVYEKLVTDLYDSLKEAKK